MKTMSAVSVKVNRKHISNGTEQDTETCAVALAVKEHFEKLKLPVSVVDVTEEGVEVSFDNIHFASTKKLVDFITAFDNSEKVKPVTIQLRQD